MKEKGIINKSIDWNRARDSFDKQIVEEVLANPPKNRLDEYDYIEKGGSSE